MDTLEFVTGSRVIVTRALHPDHDPFCGKQGTVLKVIKNDCTALVHFEDLDETWFSMKALAHSKRGESGAQMIKEIQEMRRARRSEEEAKISASASSDGTNPSSEGGRKKVKRPGVVVEVPVGNASLEGGDDDTTVTDAETLMANPLPEDSMPEDSISIPGLASSRKQLEERKRSTCCMEFSLC